MLDELLHIRFSEQIVSPINGLITYSDGWNVAKRSATAIDKGVEGIDEIRIDVLGLYGFAIVIDALSGRMSAHAESHNHHMHMCLQRSLAIPPERSISKVYRSTPLHQWCPQIGHLLALRNTVGRDERSMAFGILLHELNSLVIPRADIIDVA